MNDKVQIPVRAVVDKQTYGHLTGRVAVAHQLLMPNQVAALAGELAKESMTNAGTVGLGGWSAQGRAVYCCNLAEELYKEFQERGWLIALPDPTAELSTRESAHREILAQRPDWEGSAEFTQDELQLLRIVGTTFLGDKPEQAQRARAILNGLISAGFKIARVL